MNLTIELFGYLTLTVLGFVLPITAILLSVFSEGLSKLRTKYERSQERSEKNLRTQLAKQAKQKKGADVEAIARSIAELKSVKKAARRKLSYLAPRRQIVQLFVPLMIAFLAVVASALLVETDTLFGILLVISAVGLSRAVLVLWRLAGVLVETRTLIDDDRRVAASTTTELLSKIAEKTGRAGAEPLLKRVHLIMDGTTVEDKKTRITFQSDIKRELQISLLNSEDRTLKNAEVGITFPAQFVIEERRGYAISNSGEWQIVRFDETLIHGGTHLDFFDKLAITGIEKGDFNIGYFIKGENVLSIRGSFTLRVE